MFQPLRSRLDYDENPKVVAQKSAEMFKTIPMQDYDSCPCQEEQGPCEGMPQQMPQPMPQQVPQEKQFEQVIDDYDEETSPPDGDGGTVIILRRVFAHCMDQEFKKIKSVMSKLEPKDKKIVESALDKIHKKYRDLERSQEDDGK